MNDCLDIAAPGSLGEVSPLWTEPQITQLPEARSKEVVSIPGFEYYRRASQQEYGEHVPCGQASLRFCSG